MLAYDAGEPTAIMGVHYPRHLTVSDLRPD